MTLHATISTLELLPKTHFFYLFWFLCSYAEALPRADCVEVTEIAQDFDGDAYAPVLGPEWVETAREHHVSTNGLPFSFVTRVRRS